MLSKVRVQLVFMVTQDVFHFILTDTDNVKKLLCNYGFAHIFNENGHYSLNGFPVIFKQRVIDCFKQDWHSSLDNNSVLLYFKQF